MANTWLWSNINIYIYIHIFFFSSYLNRKFDFQCLGSGSKIEFSTLIGYFLASGKKTRFPTHLTGILSRISIIDMMKCCMYYSDRGNDFTSVTLVTQYSILFSRGKSESSKIHSTPWGGVKKIYLVFSVIGYSK